MKVISLKPVVDQAKCIGCGICAKVCPAVAITVTAKKAVIAEEHCRGCGGCNQRCPVEAIAMVRMEKPYQVAVAIDDVDYQAITRLCVATKLHPEQIICYCTTTRAEEVAAAILKGARSPEELSRQTGIRMGCKVECIQPVLRLLQAAGITPERPPGYQWYGLTPTVWDIPEAVKAKYNSRGFYFDEDIKLLEQVVHASVKKEEGK